MNDQDIQHTRSTVAPSTAILQARGASQFQTVTIYGGTGGNGGVGRAGGQGGGGGDGEGPRLNYDIGAGIFTVNLVVQGHEREFSGATRNLHRQIRTRSTPYDSPSPPHLALTGFTGGNHSSDLHPPSSGQAIAAFDTTPSSAPQFTPTRAASSITLPSFRLLFPDSEFPPLAGSNHARHVHADSASSSNLPPFRLALPDTQFAPPAEVNRYASDRYQSSPAFDSERQRHTRESRADSSGSASWFGAPSRPSYVEPVLGHSGTSITFNERQGEVGIHTLHRTVALEALFDSAESFPQPRCHPETRTELLDKLYTWAIDPDSAHPIQWLHGPAGAGKSAIMQTLCRRLQGAGHLGGSFFFKRGHKTCGNAQMLFATLAYQLALKRRELKRPISGSVELDPSVLGRDMDVQLRTLILEPCQLLTDETPSVLLIDGLDECAGHHIQRQILQLIGADVWRSLRILVASRPEPHIRETFEDQSFQGLCEFTNIEQSFEDIRTYLCKEFSRIHDEHQNTMKGIPTPWPSPQIVEMLVEKSSGYFIYASTVIKLTINTQDRRSDWTLFAILPLRTQNLHSQLWTSCTFKSSWRFLHIPVACFATSCL
ncbi:hypothetical protein B0H11DRAFT_330881 [Mycena galericulata]|nr:hypothetical protein B0H11DRAFT_330881 [Mycena galericulata]